MTPMQRFQEKYQPVTETGCWLWTGAMNQLGYGRFNHNKKVMQAHRAAWELLRGEIPEGAEIDHLCKIRCCVNPEHLEPVDRITNMQRSDVWGYRRKRTHCPKGHELSASNIYNLPGHSKYLCHTCLKDRKARYRAKQKEVI